MPDLATAVCSITPTQRRRYFWAAWWTSAPQHSPFRKPDASNGGARSPEEALAEALRVAGRHLVVIEPYWARAWNRVLRGEQAPPLPTQRTAAPERPRARPGLRHLQGRGERGEQGAAGAAPREQAQQVDLRAVLAGVEGRVTGGRGEGDWRAIGLSIPKRRE
jgi:hypothetical protein